MIKRLACAALALILTACGAGSDEPLQPVMAKPVVCVSTTPTSIVCNERG